MRSLGLLGQLSILLLAAAAAAPGCAAKQHGGGVDDMPFECNERRAAYQVTGSIRGASYSVKMSCDGNIPTVEEIRGDEEGSETRKQERISAVAWESAWKDLENLGWRGGLSDCDGGDGGDKAPFWVVEIGDDEQSMSITCKTETLPFPFDALVGSLDGALREMHGGE